MVYSISKRALGFYCQLYVKKVEGLENLPMDKPFIMACNQESHIDAFLTTPIVLDKINKKIYHITRFGWGENKVGFLSKLSLFITKPILTRWTGCMPTLKKGGMTDSCIKLLRRGAIIGIFPEGKRNPSKTLLKAKTGAARIALAAKVPVIPIGIKHSHKILPIGAIVPRFKRAVINIGKPLYFDKNYNKAGNRKILEKVTREIMKNIASLCGKRYLY